mmetsp:Transcript_13821/g.22897  ORF Transcript_13821/g.22897 Transcript_13821/m.22897 type:complete len:337 (+) Transcript_13821:35-1045(+)
MCSTSSIRDESMTTETEKRTADELELERALDMSNKKPKTEGGGLEALASASSATDDADDIPGAPMSKARENRLEQNRKAARESRRRKKLMIEELQRSVIFFSKANSTLKMQNDEFTRRLMEAQARVAAVEGSKDHNQAQVIPNAVKQLDNQKQPDDQNVPPQFLNEQNQAQAVATQAMYESQGFPAGAARAAAQAMNASTPGPTPDGGAPTMQPGANGLPQMQPGATMQAMAAFQQAAAQAMQAAMGMNPTAAANPQQAYADAMNAFAQQAGQQAQFAAQQQGMPQGSYMGFPHAMVPMQWQQQQQQPGATKPVAVAQPPQQQQQQPMAQAQQTQI